MIGALVFEIVFFCVCFEELWSDHKPITLFSIVSIFMNVFLVVWMVGGYAPLYLSSSSKFMDTDMFNVTSDLLSCASERMPHLSVQFVTIEECLKHVQLYEVRNGRVPYLRRIPQAFVLSFDDDSVFVSSRFLLMSLVDRALVMIHECAHIGLGAKDYAYVWQDHFEDLTYDEHLSNADSFMHVVANYCTI